MRRVQTLKVLLQKATELVPKESRLHQSLEPHARDVLKGKRLLLFQELLSSMSFPDKDLTADTQEGFRLTGCLQDTRTRPGKVIVHALTGEDVWSGRKSNNDRMWATCRPSGDPQLNQDLWQQTLKECKAGWAMGHVARWPHQTSRQCSAFKKIWSSAT